MSYTKRYIEWDVPYNEVQHGIPIGFEVELSQNSNFNPVNYSLNTYDTNHEHLTYAFFYSLDEGDSWTIYPYGDFGKVFNQAFKMRLEINAGQAESLIVLNGNQIYKLSGDTQVVKESLQIANDSILDVGHNDYLNVLTAVGNDTLYRIQTSPNLQYYANSLNINNEKAMGVVVDGTRNSFWQINRDSVCLKDWFGNSEFCIDLPTDVDTDFSSSSSSSSEGYSSSSSSSSGGHSSSSSSSSSWGYSSSSSEGYSSSSSSGSSSSSSSSSIDSSSSSSSSAFHLIMAKATGFDKHPAINGYFYFDGYGDNLYPDGINDNGAVLRYSTDNGIGAWRIYASGSRYRADYGAYMYDDYGEDPWSISYTTPAGTGTVSKYGGWDGS